MNEKLLKWLIYIAGVVCLYGYISIRSLPVMNLVLAEKMIPEHWDFVKYGELYYFNYVSHFKRELPKAQQKYRFSDKFPEINEADILMFGDSFLDISRQTTLPERLNDTLGERVYFHRFIDPHQSDPLCVLQEEQYLDGTTRVVIYESVERNIPIKFDESFESAVCDEGEQGTLKNVADAAIELAFPGNSEEMYKQVLKRSIFTTNLFGLFATMKFDLFGFISSQTPVYKVADDPWLFYYPQVNDEPGSFYYHYTQEEIDTYCDNIATMRNQLKENYDLEMIFLPVPSKYTICHTVVNNDPYNDFLPRLYAGLEEREVLYINLYDKFMQKGPVLYYGTDTHWNKKGVDIALTSLVEKLNSINAGKIVPLTQHVATEQPF